jgi:hypothetical protein
MERPAKERDSRVDKTGWAAGRYLSTTGLEEPCGNLGGPSPKAKYYLTTDSEPVP